MITRKRLETGQIVINANDIDLKEEQELIDKYNLTQQIINYAHDKFERPRIIYDSDLDCYLMVISIPSIKENLDKTVQSITIVANDEEVVCFTNSYSQYVMNYIIRFLSGYSGIKNSAMKMFLDLITEISNDFLDGIKPFYDEEDQIQSKLKDSHHRQKTIVRLANLQSKITYCVTSTSDNAALTSEINDLFQSYDAPIKMNDSLSHKLSSAHVESYQAVRSFELINDITQQLSGTYNNLLNNETNDVMRVLTVYSLVLTIPSIIVGFFGMNVRLPLSTNNQWSWVITIIITVVLSVVLVLDMIRRHLL